MASEAMIAWAAGFFDGEGSITACRDNKNGRRISVQMSVAQSGPIDRPPLSLIRFHETIGGVGKIYPRPFDDRLGKKPMWYWRASNVDDVRRVVSTLVPYLIEKIDQVAEAMARRHEWEGLFADRQRFCKRGHEFTPENIYKYINRPTPARLCRACARERNRDLRARRRALGVPVAAVEGTG